jgi:catechol 2,3-dioxygenase-like lactoylglutathione lyase family enzyme
MPVQLNHTIVLAHDAAESAGFLAALLGRGAPTRYGPFHCVALDNGVTLDYMNSDHVQWQHYAFIVGETEFDVIFARIRERGLEYWADPFLQQPGKINHNDGGRGVYWKDPNGHILEIITRPYGGTS